MKKIFLKIAALALCGVMGLGILAACDESAEVPPPDEKPPVEEDPTEEQPVDRSDLAYYTSLEEYKKTDWNGAKWIWASTTSVNSYVAFRKTFSLDKVPAEAVANIAAESKYYLWMNEELAVFDGASKRGATPYDGFYEQVDLADYLKQGENTLVILVSYNGRGGNSSVDPGKAGLLFQMQAGDVTVVSDSSFKANRLRAYRNKGLLGADWPNYSQSSMLAEWNVYYDARESVGDYTASDFDDSSWENATVVAEAGGQPFNDTYLSVIPLMKFDEEYTFLESEYIGQKLTQDTIITIDLPENMQFSPYFELTAESSGLRFTYYTNTLTSQGIDSFRDDYVTAGGEQTYESLPWRSGSQLIIEAPAGITFTKIGYRRSGYDSERSGSFVTENEDVNTLWEKAVNTLLICMRDTYMDCPERERSPYIGDAANQIGETFYSLDENSWAMTKKTILNIIGWTKTDNCIPLRSPSLATNENPVQTLNFLVSVYEYLLYTGDEATVRLFYPVAVNYLKLWELNDDGSIVYRNGTFMWVDWGDGADAEVLQNCWYYYALSSTQKLAKALGISSDEAFFTERIQKVAAGFAKFKKQGGYSSGTAYDDRANAMAVVSGLAYDDPMWDELLDQIDFSDEEAISALITYGLYMTQPLDDIGLVQTGDNDGPLGLTATWSGTVGHVVACAWTSAPLTAATWNTDLVYEMGLAIGQEGLTNGIHGWYAPAVNLHRSPFGGRNFEYYSEDPLISGKIGAAMVSGARQNGLFAHIKHFALNEMDHARGNIQVYATEQSMREMYLRGFEIATKEAECTIQVYDGETGGQKTVELKAAGAYMTSMTFIGPKFSGASYELLTTLLRNEWGFEGFVITDFTSGDNKSKDCGYKVGNDLWMGMRTTPLNDLDTATAQWAARNAIKNIAYTIVNSSAYNGIAPGSYAYYDMSPWRIGLIVFDVIAGVIAAAGVAWVVLRTVDEKRHPEKYRKGGDDNE